MCADWGGPGVPVTPDMYFSGSEVPDDANLTGAIMLAFGENSAGTPKDDDFDKGARSRIRP